MKRRVLGGLGLLALSLAGCTRLNVTRIDPNKSDIGIKGARFALPIPVIQVTPKSDGSVEVTDKVLPDPNATFAADSWALLAQSTLQVDTEGGIVKTITWNPNDAALLTQAISSGATIGSTVLAAQQKAQQDAADKAAADSAAARNARQAAQEAVDDTFRRWRALVDGGADNGDIAVAKGDYDVALFQCQQVFGRPCLPRAGGGIANAPGLKARRSRIGNANDGQPSFPGVYGPLLFGIRETWTQDKQGVEHVASVELVPLHEQTKYSVGGSRRPDTNAPPVTGNLKATVGANEVTLTIQTANGEKFGTPRQSMTDLFRLQNGSTITVPNSQPTMTLGADATTLILQWSPPLPAGNYRVELSTESTEAGQPDWRFKVPFTVGQ